MQYLLMICTDEAVDEGLNEAQMTELLKDYGAFGAELESSGALLGGNRLRPISTATCVQVRKGETLVTDGPFAETKEQMGGYYVVEAASLDEAIAWAAKIPSARLGTIEVRPIWEIEAH